VYIGCGAKGVAAGHDGAGPQGEVTDHNGVALSRGTAADQLLGPERPRLADWEGLEGPRPFRWDNQSEVGAADYGNPWAAEHVAHTRTADRDLATMCSNVSLTAALLDVLRRKAVNLFSGCSPPWVR
jgi:hypothetical protein